MTTDVTSSDTAGKTELELFESSVEHHFALNEGVRIHYAASGTGPLMVLLHGFPDHWLGWWQVMHSLRRDYRVLALDMRGYNLSDKPEEAQAYAVQHLVADVQAVIEQEGGSSAIIVGHDWGGFVAWHVAMDAPALVDALVVLNMPHPWAIARELAKNPEQQKASEYVRMFRQPESHLHFPAERLGAWVINAEYRVRQDKAMELSSLDGMFNYYRVNWPTEPYVVRTDNPSLVKAPTLLIHGLNDPYALPAGLNDVWHWIDNELDICTLPHAGHFIQHDNAHKVVMRIRQWLQQRES